MDRTETFIAGRSLTLDARRLARETPRMVGTRSTVFASLLGLALFAGCSSGETAASTGGAAPSASSSSSTTGAGGEAGSATVTASASGAGGGEVAPEKPAGLTTWTTGNAVDAAVAPAGPALILMGGGTDVDAAFTWWKPYVNGGDIVVLRASGADGYNDYLYTQIGGVDSVETLLVTSPELANSAYVSFAISHAEGVFLAGGDQASYLAAWKGTGVESALQAAWARGAAIGGTSAGCDVLGPFIFGALHGSVFSDEALKDPYNQYMTMDRDFLALPPLAGFLLDTHFAERDRMGRLVGFLGRVLTDGWAPAAHGLGIDEATALVVDPKGQGTVLGSGAAYLLDATTTPAVCAAGKPLEYAGLALHKLVAGDTVALPSGATTAPATTLSASGGALTPANPY
jgi:cyanophycinase